MKRNDETAARIDDVEELTHPECYALFSRAAENIGFAPQEFERKWRAGDFANDPDPCITRVAMLMPHPWQSPPNADHVPPARGLVAPLDRNGSDGA
jgi:hypothetical protein